MSIKSKLVIVSQLLRQSSEHFRQHRYQAAYCCYQIECEIMDKKPASFEDWLDWMESFTQQQA